ncbi:hypothetical protein VTN02DRAFT_2493 [Thermoascus thermophilus]
MGLRMTLRLKMTVLHIDLLLAGSLPSSSILLYTYTVLQHGHHIISITVYDLFNYLLWRFCCSPVYVRMSRHPSLSGWLFENINLGFRSFFSHPFLPQLQSAGSN